LQKLGGESLLKEVEQKLGDEFNGIYETLDVPYTLYAIYKGAKILGYIHGINQKGRYGGLQVFLAFDENLAIKDFYFQKLTSKKAKEMRSPEFAKQFKGLSFADFADYDPKTNSGGSARVQSIQNPNPDDDTDFKAALRAVKKNFILAEIFLKK